MLPIKAADFIDPDYQFTLKYDHYIVPRRSEPEAVSIEVDLVRPYLPSWFF